MKPAKMSLLIGFVIIVMSSLLLIVWNAPIISYCTIIGFEAIATIAMNIAVNNNRLNKTMLLSGLMTTNIIGLIAYILIALFASNSYTIIILISGIISLIYIVLFYFASRTIDTRNHYGDTKKEYENCMLLLEQVILKSSSDIQNQLIEVKEILKLLDLTKGYSFSKCEKLLEEIKNEIDIDNNIESLKGLVLEFKTYSNQAKLGDI